MSDRDASVRRVAGEGVPEIVEGERLGKLGQIACGLEASPVNVPMRQPPARARGEEGLPCLGDPVAAKLAQEVHVLVRERHEAAALLRFRRRQFAVLRPLLTDVQALALVVHVRLIEPQQFALPEPGANGQAQDAAVVLAGRRLLGEVDARIQKRRDPLVHPLIGVRLVLVLVLARALVGGEQAVGVDRRRCLRRTARSSVPFRGRR